MRRQLLAVPIALMFALVAASLPNPAYADPPATVVQVTGPVGARIGDTVELHATLVDSTGAPVPHVQLVVTEQLVFLEADPSEATVASAATDESGVAVIRYVARREGTRDLLVQFMGNENFAPSSVAFQLPVEVGAATYTVAAPPGIPGVNRFVLIAVLVVLWGTMLIVAGHVTAIARRGARDIEPEQQRETSRVMTWGAPVTYLAAVLIIGITLIGVLVRSPDTKANFQPTPADYHRTEVAIVGQPLAYEGFPLADPRSAQTGDPVHDGEALFLNYGCMSCHGVQAEGGAVGKDLSRASALKFNRKVRSGVAGMPAYSVDQLPDADLEQIIAYVQSVQ